MPHFGDTELKEAPEDIKPKCPHCKIELDNIWTLTKGTGFIGKEQILLCPHCRSFLSYSSYRR